MAECATESNANGSSKKKKKGRPNKKKKSVYWDEKHDNDDRDDPGGGWKSDDSTNDEKKYTWNHFYKKSGMKFLIQNGKLYESVISGVEARILISNYRGIPIREIDYHDPAVKYLSSKQAIRIRRHLKSVHVANNPDDIIWAVLENKYNESNLFLKKALRSRYYRINTYAKAWSFHPKKRRQIHFKDSGMVHHQPSTRTGKRMRKDRLGIDEPQPRIMRGHSEIGMQSINPLKVLPICQTLSENTKNPMIEPTQSSLNTSTLRIFKTGLINQSSIGSSSSALSTPGGSFHSNTLNQFGSTRMGAATAHGRLSHVRSFPSIRGGGPSGPPSHRTSFQSSRLSDYPSKGNWSEDEEKREEYTRFPITSSFPSIKNRYPQKKVSSDLDRLTETTPLEETRESPEPICPEKDASEDDDDDDDDGAGSGPQRHHPLPPLFDSCSAPNPFDDDSTGGGAGGGDGRMGFGLRKSHLSPLQLNSTLAHSNPPPPRHDSNASTYRGGPHTPNRFYGHTPFDECDDIMTNFNFSHVTAQRGGPGTNVVVAHPSHHIMGNVTPFSENEPINHAMTPVFHGFFENRPDGGGSSISSYDQQSNHLLPSSYIHDDEGKRESSPATGLAMLHRGSSSSSPPSPSPSTSAESFSRKHKKTNFQRKKRTDRTNLTISTKHGSTMEPFQINYHHHLRLREDESGEDDDDDDLETPSVNDYFEEGRISSFEKQSDSISPQKRSMNHFSHPRTIPVSFIKKNPQEDSDVEREYRIHQIQEQLWAHQKEQRIEIHTPIVHSNQNSGNRLTLNTKKPRTVTTSGVEYSDASITSGMLLTETDSEDDDVVDNGHHGHFRPHSMKRHERRPHPGGPGRRRGRGRGRGRRLARQKTAEKSTEMSRSVYLFTPDKENSPAGDIDPRLILERSMDSHEIEGCHNPSSMTFTDSRVKLSPERFYQKKNRIHHGRVTLNHFGSSMTTTATTTATTTTTDRDTTTSSGGESTFTNNYVLYGGASVMIGNVPEPSEYRNDDGILAGDVSGDDLDDRESVLDDESMVRLSLNESQS